MRVLFLTNYDHIDFVAGTAIHYADHDFSFKYKGEYDWSEEYDVGISFMYQYKVPTEQVNSHPWFNFHPAPLPEYKGRNLCYHALLNGEKEFGATVHYMDENFDTGDIIEVSKFPIFPEDTAEDVSYHAIGESKNLFIKYLPKILAEEDFLRYPNRHTIYYPKETINSQIELPPHIKNRIRAITYKEHYPRVNIGGVMYKIVKE